MQCLCGNDRRRVYQWCGVFAVIVAVLLMIVLLSHNIITDKKRIPAFLGGYCAILATVLSVLHILQHLSCFADPECQTKVVRILFMVPLYAMASWFSILWPAAGEYLNLVRDAYESYAIYAFFSLMIAQMGGVDTLYRALMVEERPALEHYFPLCWAEPMKITPRFVQHCRLSLFQFMVLKPAITLVIIVLTARDQMSDDILDPGKGYLWTSLLYNISITIAFYALVYFYQGLHDFLEGKNALAKFLCIKAIIFLSYWQGFVIAILAAVKTLPKFDYWNEKDAASGLQDFLICVEMLFVAFGHMFCFPATEFNEGPLDDEESVSDVRVLPPMRRSIAANLRYTLQHEDVLRDVSDIVHRR